MYCRSRRDPQLQDEGAPSSAAYLALIVGRGAGRGAGRSAGRKAGCAVPVRRAQGAERTAERRGAKCAVPVRRAQGAERGAGRREAECAVRVRRAPSPARTSSTRGGRIEQSFVTVPRTTLWSADGRRADGILSGCGETRPQCVHTPSAAPARCERRSPQYRPHTQHVVVARRRIPQYVVFLGLDCTGGQAYIPPVGRARREPGVGRREPREGGRERLATVQLEE
jgi:hypothetical protein